MFGGRYHQEEYSGSNTSSTPNGQLVRVPKHDSVMVPTKRRMIVPVDPVTLEAIDPVEKYLGHPASLSENGGEEHNTTIVYIPPYFKVRVSALARQQGE